MTTHLFNRLNFFALVLISVLLTSCATTTKTRLDASVLESFRDQERAKAGWVEKSIVTKAGDTVFYNEGGNLDGETLLLIHGFSGSKDDWNRVVGGLMEQYHVVALDLFAHGKTQTLELNSEELTVFGLSDFVREFVNAKELDVKHVGGHSLGGATAIAYLNFYGSRIKSLLLVNSAGNYQDNKSEYIKNPELLRNTISLRGKGDIKRVINFIMERPPFIPDEVLALQEAQMLTNKKEQQLLFDGLLNDMRNVKGHVWDFGLARIRVPTLLVWGEKDKIIPPVVTKELEEHITGEVTTKILPGVGHFPMLEAEFDTTDILNEFYLK